MNVVALLSFYDEPMEFLWALVKSISGRVDRLVAVDGAYDAYPWSLQGYEHLDGTTSGPDQRIALEGACATHGIELVYHVPGGPWEGNEVQKRNFLFELAQNNSDPGDWFWVVDGDEEVNHLEDGFCQKLDKTELDTARIIIADMGYSIVGRAGEPLCEPTPISVPAEVRMFFRRFDEAIRVGSYHSHYIAPNGKVLWKGMDAGDEDSLELDGFVWHKALQRPKLRAQQRVDYYNRAVILGLDKYM